jgi:MFS family permease
MSTASTADAGDVAVREYKIWQVISASAAGTVIEWYDFYIFGTLAAIISPKFYPEGNDTLALIAYLSTFAVGFIVRPFGAIFFGRIGDLVGRKYAFLVTLLIMGLGTAAIGIMPTYEQIGYLAPVLLLLIRVLQGLALGGEYGGAAIYVAEHVPDEKRGFYTSFIQITATAGLFIALLTVLFFQQVLGAETFADWGWRLPFLLSIVLVATSLYIRLRMKESPIFSTLKSRGQTSRTPIRDALGKGSKENWKVMLRSLFGATVGQGVVWYTGQFYALFYLQTILKVEPKTANIVIAIALLLGMPLFTFFGNLSDRIGRKRIMMAGCIIAAVCYIPIYRAMVWAAGNDVARVSHDTGVASTDIKLTPIDSAGNPVDIASDPNLVALVLLVLIQVVFVTMVYGPIAAYLVEAFPAKIRYTSLSLPYHIGNGVFGGLLPVTALLLNAWTGNIYAGLLYPIFFALVTFVVGTKFLPETKDVRIWDELEAKRHHTETPPEPASALGAAPSAGR